MMGPQYRKRENEWRENGAIQRSVKKKKKKSSALFSFTGGPSPIQSDNPIHYQYIHISYPIGSISSGNVFKSSRSKRSARSLLAAGKKSRSSPPISILYPRDAKARTPILSGLVKHNSE